MLSVSDMGGGVENSICFAPLGLILGIGKEVLTMS